MNFENFIDFENNNIIYKFKNLNINKIYEKNVIKLNNKIENLSILKIILLDDICYKNFYYSIYLTIKNIYLNEEKNQEYKIIYNLLSENYFNFRTILIERNDHNWIDSIPLLLIIIISSIIKIFINENFLNINENEILKIENFIQKLFLGYINLKEGYLHHYIIYLLFNNKKFYKKIKNNKNFNEQLLEIALEKSLNKNKIQLSNYFSLYDQTPLIQNALELKKIIKIEKINNNFLIKNPKIKTINENLIKCEVISNRIKILTKHHNIKLKEFKKNIKKIQKNKEKSIKFISDNIVNF